VTTTQILPRKERMALGIVFIAVGVLAALDYSGVPLLHGLTRWWALLLIGVGIIKLRQPLEQGQRGLGVALLLVGGFAQVQALIVWTAEGPIWLVLIGGFLVWRGLEPRPEMALASDDGLVSDLAVLGGIKRALSSAAFRGGYLTAVLGGIELDLRSSKMATSPTTVDVFALWGGIELKVPSEWVVDVQGIPIMGGFENKASGPAGIEAPRLVVRGHAIMGGVTVGR
jgi:hypothetical protein